MDTMAGMENEAAEEAAVTEIRDTIRHAATCGSAQADEPGTDAGTRASAQAKEAGAQAKDVGRVRAAVRTAEVRAAAPGWEGPAGPLLAANADEALEAALALAREAAAGGWRSCVVTASADQAAEVRRSLAASGGALGVEALPWGLWLADRWELLGDGRRFADRGVRLALAASALDEELGAEATPGRVALLDALVAEDLPALVDKARRGDDLAPDERRMLGAAERYAARIAACGLVEPSEACVLLAAACGGAARPDAGAAWSGAGGCPDAAAACAAGPGVLGERVVALGFEEGDLTRPQAALLRAAGARVVMNARASTRRAARVPELAALLDALYRPDPAHPVAPTGAVRCAFPTGATIEERLIADVVLDLAHEAVSDAAARADGGHAGAAAAGEAGQDAGASASSAADADAGRAASALVVPAPVGAGAPPSSAFATSAARPLVAVAALDPEALFADLADELAARGVAAALEAPVPLSRISAGRLMLALAKALAADEGRLAADAAADAALCEASGASRPAAFRTDRAWRRDRLISVDAVIDGLADLGGDALADALGHLRAGRLVQGADSLATALAAHARGEGERAVTAAALAPVLAAAPAAEEAGLSFSRLMALLAGRAVPVSLRVEPADGGRGEVDPGDSGHSGGGAGMAGEACPAPAAAAVPDSRGGAPAAAVPRAGAPAPLVLFTTLERAGRLAPGRAYALVACGLNSDERPVRAPESARATLLAKLGAAAPADALAAQRRRFRDAAEAARGALVLERALNGVGAEPRYPATLFEEAVDCYRDDLCTDAGMDRDLAIPLALVPFARTLTESRFVYGACGADAQPAALELPCPCTGAISEALAPFITLPRVPASVTREGLDLSPSAIESYLDCPYCWFVKRRLALEEPDEGFGALECGTFVHEVLQAFYLRLWEIGEPRVTEANRERALEVLDAVFDDACAAQSLRRPGRRYVPVDRRERDLREALRPDLARYVAAEASFLPGFVPAHLEWSYGSEGGVPYAGHWLKGAVDRIDVDGKGRAVVIDYKTSLGSAYHLHGRDVKPGAPFVLPRKMQALIYARVVERLLGVRVVGALYVNPLRGAVAGAFDARSLDAAAVPGLDPRRSCVPYGDVGSFAELLERAEEEVTHRLSSLAAGDVRPNPSDKDACRWCPAVICERRL